MAYAASDQKVTSRQSARRGSPPKSSARPVCSFPAADGLFPVGGHARGVQPLAGTPARRATLFPNDIHFQVPSPAASRKAARRALSLRSIRRPSTPGIRHRLSGRTSSGGCLNGVTTRAIARFGALPAAVGAYPARYIKLSQHAIGAERSVSSIGDVMATNGKYRRH